MTLEQFASTHRISLQHARRIVHSSDGVVEYKGSRYAVRQVGAHERNGKPLVIIKPVEETRKTKHLSAEERSRALDMLHRGSSYEEIADALGCTHWTIRRLAKHKNVERKRRADAGSVRKGLNPEAVKLFDAFYVQNAQKNVKLAYDLMMRQYEGFDMPYNYFRRRAREIEPIRLRHHYEAKFDKKHAPRINRDLWTEFEFLEVVSLDGWVVPDRCLKSNGEEEADQFTFNGKDVSMVCIFAFDVKTGYPLAWKAFERSVNQEDVLSLLLEVVYKWGRPSGYWLMDNGTEFTNDAVQRFVRGLYTTGEHDVKERVVFSEPYGPFGKARHERQHKIFKDEFCSFSPSYSPNQAESRKPTKALSYVKPQHTLAQWTEKFEAYLNGLYMERERSMWLNRDYKRHHAINENRPRTLTEAFERAYSSFVPLKIEPMKLAFLYAKKFRGTLRNSTLRHSYAGENFVYVPEGDGIPLERYNETFEVVVDPTNLGRAWVCDLNGEFVCEACDLRYKGNAVPLTRERAAAARKLRNKVNKLAKDKAKAMASLANYSEAIARKTARRNGEQIETRNIEQSLYTDPNWTPPAIDQITDEEYLNIALDVYDDEAINQSHTSEEDNNE